MKDRNCPVCGKKDSSILFAESNYDSIKLNQYSYSARKVPEYMHYRLLKCKNCNILYSTNIPEEEVIISAYNEADFNSLTEAELASQTYIKYIKNIAIYNKESAMDIGTGNGSFLKELLNIGFKNVIGIEPSKEPIRQACDSIKPFIINDSFIPDNFIDNSFDLISCFQTLEHVYTPNQVIEGIFKLLKKDGFIYIISHDYEAFTNKIMGMKSPIYDIEHMQLFSQKGLRVILENNGFKEIKIFKIKNKYQISYLAKLFPFPKAIKNCTLNFLHKTHIGNITPNLYIGNIGVIAKK